MKTLTANINTTTKHIAINSTAAWCVIAPMFSVIADDSNFNGYPKHQNRVRMKGETRGM